MPLHSIKVENPDGLNMVIGQSRVTKPVEDICKALVSTIPDLRFGLAFNEDRDATFLHYSGTDQALIDLAKRNAKNIGANDIFVLFLDPTIAVNVMRALKNVPEISEIYCATARPIEVIVVDTDQGRGVMGLADDYSSSNPSNLRVKNSEGS